MRLVLQVIAHFQRTQLGWTVKDNCRVVTCTGYNVEEIKSIYPDSVYATGTLFMATSSIVSSLEEGPQYRGSMV
jgi:hypothetical protein